MAMVISGISSVVKSFFPPPGVERRIVAAWLVLSLANNFMPRERLVDTFAPLKGRVSNPTPAFTKWLQEKYKLKLNPGNVVDLTPILNAELLADLIHKVSVVAAYYLTSQLVLSEVLRNFLSQSQKVSEVALPILNQLSSLPIPTFLLSTPVIVLTPLVLKIVHSFLSVQSLDTEKDTSSPMKEIANVIGILNNMLEIAFHVRFSLLCLCLAEPTSNALIRSFLSQVISFSPLGPYFQQNLHLAEVYPIVMKFVLPLNNWSSSVLDSSLYYTIKSLQHLFSQPFNALTAINLYDQIETLRVSPHNLQSFKDLLEKIQKEIDHAYDHHQIDLNLKNSLTAMLREEGEKCLEQVIETDPTFGSSQEKLALFMSIYGPQGILTQHHLRFDQKAYENLLDAVQQKLNNLQEATDHLLKLSVSLENAQIPDQQKEFIRKVVYTKLERFFKDHVLSNLEDDAFLRNEENEKLLRKLYGQNSYFHDLSPASKKKSAELITHRLLFAFFNSHFNYYLENEARLTPEGQKTYEFLLSNQVTSDHLFDHLFDVVFLSENFRQWVEKQNETYDVENIYSALPKYNSSYKEFDYLINMKPLPAHFKFVTSTLPANLLPYRNWYTNDNSKKILRGHLPSTPPNDPYEDVEVLGFPSNNEEKPQLTQLLQQFYPKGTQEFPSYANFTKRVFNS